MSSLHTLLSLLLLTSIPHTLSAPTPPPSNVQRDSSALRTGWIQVLLPRGQPIGCLDLNGKLVLGVENECAVFEQKKGFISSKSANGKLDCGWDTGAWTCKKAAEKKDEDEVVVGKEEIQPNGRCFTMKSNAGGKLSETFRIERAPDCCTPEDVFAEIEGEKEAEIEVKWCWEDWWDKRA